MKFVTINNPNTINTDCIMLGLFEKSPLSNLAQELNSLTQNAISNSIELGDFTGELGQTLVLRPLPNKNMSFTRILLVGLGSADKCNTTNFGKAAVAAFNTLVKLPITSVMCLLDQIDVVETTLMYRVRLLVQTALTTNYQFNVYKSQKTDKTHLLKEVYFHSEQPLDEAIKEGSAIANGVNLSRELANMPSNICNPAYLADQAIELGKQYTSIEVKVLEEDKLKELKMGALLAVGQGSHIPPRLIELNYQGGSAELSPIVLVGKGITFDTGGISLKPPAGMEDMKFDMAGAASVLGTLKAIAELKLPINVVGIIPTAENMPDGHAYRPGDILTSMSGLTIEVVNTDAEGRLILCDALTYAERFHPTTVIDIATLTGAMVVALGYLFNGIFSNQDDLAKELIAAGKRSSDLAWHMPLVEEYQEALKSHYADMINASRLAGAITATCFLARFTEKFRWAHIDCAGTAMPADNNKAGGATGRPVPLLVEYLLHVSKS